MRSSTLISLLIALVLAGVAVFGARTWLNEERQRIFTEAAVDKPAEETAPKNTIVVANETLEFGERITRDKLREIEWASDVTPRGSYTKIPDLVVSDAEEDARFVIATMEPGEPILSTKITEPGQRAKLSTSLTPGMKAMSIRVNDVNGVAGFVLPGDRVDVLLTRASRRDGGGFVDVLLQGVKVLAIDQIADDRKDQPSVVRTVTFEVNTEEAQKLILGANVGTLSLALRNIASTDVEQSRRVTLTDLGEMDIAEDLIPDPEAERLSTLESMLKGFTEGMDQRMQNVEQSLQNQEPVVIEKEVVKEVQVPAPVVRPTRPSQTTVGVIRNGRRDEYRVRIIPEEEQQ